MKEIYRYRVDPIEVLLLGDGRGGTAGFMAAWGQHVQFHLECKNRYLQHTTGWSSQRGDYEWEKAVELGTNEEKERSVGNSSGMASRLFGCTHAS